MATRTATPAETLAAPARGFLDTCETFADEASSSSVDAAAVDRFRAEARRAAARSASDAARLEASEQAAVSRTQLEGVSQERDALQAGHDTALAAMDQLRREKEKLTATMAEVAEKLRSQESQTQFLEQARTDLLTQFRSLSGQMLDGSREALLKSTKETVSEPFAKEVLQLRQQLRRCRRTPTPSSPCWQKPPAICASAAKTCRARPTSLPPRCVPRM